MVIEKRRNQYEEALFKCEDDRYEMDMVMDANRSAIKALEPIALAIKALEEQGKKDHAAALSGSAAAGSSSSSSPRFRSIARKKGSTTVTSSTLTTFAIS